MYKLKLDYTAEELKELKELRVHYFSPMNAIQDMLNVGTGNGPFENLWAKYIITESEDEFDFMADINNAVMGTAIFPENKYVVHDKAAGQYIYCTALQDNLRWGDLKSCAEKKTKEEWLEINPAYEPMLEDVEDDKVEEENE